MKNLAKLVTVALAASVSTLTLAQNQPDKQYSLWIGGPLMLEAKIPNSHFTAALGIAPGLYQVFRGPCPLL